MLWLYPSNREVATRRTTLPSRQLPTANRQLPTANRQPPTANRQPTARLLPNLEKLRDAIIKELGR
jgi:hypothetical protein